MKVKLRDVTSISTGYTFRSRLRYSSEGNFKVVQMKDLVDNSLVDCSELLKTEIKGIKEHHILKKGDLVFRSRGQNLTAAIFPGNNNDVVLSSPLIKIRTKDNSILPEFLLWTINNHMSQKFLHSRLSGTHGGIVNSSELGDLPVSIPELKIQKLIVEIAALTEKEKFLASKISELKKAYISELLIKTSKGE